MREFCRRVERIKAQRKPYFARELGACRPALADARPTVGDTIFLCEEYVRERFEQTLFFKRLPTRQERMKTKCCK